jgi:hypothetical protein
MRCLVLWIWTKVRKGLLSHPVLVSPCNLYGPQLPVSPFLVVRPNTRIPAAPRKQLRQEVGGWQENRDSILNGGGRPVLSLLVLALITTDPVARGLGAVEDDAASLFDANPWQIILATPPATCMLPTEQIFSATSESMGRIGRRPWASEQIRWAVPILTVFLLAPTQADACSYKPVPGLPSVWHQAVPKTSTDFVPEMLVPQPAPCRGLKCSPGEPAPPRAPFTVPTGVLKQVADLATSPPDPQSPSISVVDRRVAVPHRFPSSIFRPPRSR